jgi:hypothetical protein
MLDHIAQGAIGAGILLAALWNGWQSVQSKRAARAAAANSHPISNGWGTALRSDMAEVRGLVNRIHEGQLLAERRETQRDIELAEVKHAVEAHLAAHAA